MSKGNLNTQPTITKLDKLELKSSIPLIIPDNVKAKIKYLCKEISKVEWSGILLYTIEGSIRKAKDMKITLRDILLMDRGSSGYTEYDWNEDIVEYQMDNPEAIDWLKGHIHSHNTMTVFFSGVDDGELNDNCRNHNFYLSVIVNNYFEVKAKIAFTAKHKGFTCLDENGEEYTLNIEAPSWEPMMFVYDCVVESESEKIIVPEEFVKRIEIIGEKSAEREKKRAESYKNKWPTYPVVNKDDDNKFETPAERAARYNKRNTGGLGGAHKQLPPSSNNTIGNSGANYFNNNNSLQAGMWDDDEINTKRTWNKGDSIDKSLSKLEELEQREEKEITSIDEDFTAFTLRMGNWIESDTVEDAVDDIAMTDFNTDAIVEYIIANYEAFYTEFFAKLPIYNTDKEFMDMLEKVIKNLDYYDTKEDYPFLKSLIPKLKTIGVDYSQKSNHETWHSQ